MSQKNAKPVLDAVEEGLKFLREIGVEDVYRRPRRPRAAADARPASAPSGAGAGGEKALAALHAEVLSCRRCGLAASRTQAVPGEGNPRAELMFVGEGPGRDEDEQGRPFVGRAGQLLTKIIAAMTYDRSEVFIANIVKCRPPDNRVPHRDEAELCTPYLLRQIEIIGPKVIVPLGKTAADFFVPGVPAMGSLRGHFAEWRGIKIMPTFHPSYLVRNEGNKELKRMVWEDMQKVMALLGRK